MKPRIIHEADHKIPFEAIDADAVAVCKKLNHAGFTTYIVGGAVRDLLSGKTPKDFDISTAAKPDEVKKLFSRQCLLIGKRFRLAHIRFGKKIIEVASFRSGDSTDDSHIVRDNEWGTEKDDVFRRDFTINALFYNPEDRTIIDYVGGVADIQNGLIRSIGDPLVRFKQDPVRMIRLLKFQARFGFDVDVNDLEALKKCRETLLKSSPARVLEELLRMLESGASNRFFQLLSEFDILSLLIPSLDSFLKRKFGKEVFQFLEAADCHHANFKSSFLERAILLSCLLFPILEREIHKAFKDTEPLPLNLIEDLIYSLIHAVFVTSFAHFPKRLLGEVFYILSMQYRLTPKDSKKIFRQKWFHHTEFLKALTFLQIRADVHPELKQELQVWQQAYKQKSIKKAPT